MFLAVILIISCVHVHVITFEMLDSIPLEQKRYLQYYFMYTQKYLRNEISLAVYRQDFNTTVLTENQAIPFIQDWQILFAKRPNMSEKEYHNEFNQIWLNYNCHTWVKEKNKEKLLIKYAYVENKVIRIVENLVPDLIEKVVLKKAQFVYASVEKLIEKVVEIRQQSGIFKDIKEETRLLRQALEILVITRTPREFSRITAKEAIDVMNFPKKYDNITTDYSLKCITEWISEELYEKKQNKKENKF